MREQPCPLSPPGRLSSRMFPAACAKLSGINPAEAGPGYSSGMVEKLNEAGDPPRRTAPDHARDWRPLLYEHQAGTAAAAIAARLGLTERWVKARLRREADSLPPAGPARLAVKLQYVLGQAEASLGHDPAATERAAKAVLAMTKAAEAVAVFTAQHTAREAGADNDYQTRRAALEAKIARLLEAERAREGAEDPEDGSGD
ncbi:hypothetical protein [Marinicauda algicola]|nr:hypothetical protein [Marinicauda algicola]